MTCTTLGYNAPTKMAETSFQFVELIFAWKKNAWWTVLKVNPDKNTEPCIYNGIIHNVICGTLRRMYKIILIKFMFSRNIHFIEHFFNPIFINQKTLCFTKQLKPLGYNVHATEGKIDACNY